MSRPGNKQALLALQKKISQPLLVSDKSSLHYLTGQPVMDGYLLITRKQVIFFGNGLENISGLKSESWKNLGKLIQKQKTVFLENTVTADELDWLKKQGKPAKLSPIASPVLELRLHKNDYEIEQIKSAYRITEAVFSIVKKQLATKQWTEIGLARYIRIWGLELGADEISFDPIVASGRNAAIPHHTPSDAILKPGQTIVLDFGFKVNGYCSDFTRTVFIKSAPHKLAQLYQYVEQAYELAKLSVVSGIKGSEIDRVARMRLEEVKLAGEFIHSLGHGTGLAVHEAPSLSPFSKDVLLDGMVFSIEPGIYNKNKGYGFRIEDLFYLDNGKLCQFADVPVNLQSNIIK